MASSSGVMLTAEILPSPAGIDTLLVVGGLGTRNSEADPALLAWLREAARAARRVASVCTGAFVLAAAGLLDGRRGTTHWRYAASLARQYPAIRVEPDRIFVRDGKIVDLGRDHRRYRSRAGADRRRSRRGRRQAAPRSGSSCTTGGPGGQSQFSALLRLDAPGGRFGPLLGWARERLGEALPVERLAAQAAMSPRNFARAFAAETGMTPAKAIEHLRLEAARAHVEEGASRSTGSPKRPGSATRSGCGAPSSAPSASRRKRCAAPRARHSSPNETIY